MRASGRDVRTIRDLPSNCNCRTASTLTASGACAISVYAIIQAVGGTLDDSLPFIGRLAEIARRIALLANSTSLRDVVRL